MGNTSSSRRVTVVNDDVVGVVQVSENFVRRLRAEPEKSSASVASTVQEQKPVTEESTSSSRFVPFTPPEHFSSTLEQRQKYHEEFKKAEKSWQNRISELESQNRQLFDAAKDKFEKTLTEVEENHVKNSFAPVCPDKEQQVLKCYKENTKFPLNCSREVRDFIDCVEKVRMTALSK
ncbi:Coiled-coil-helix-coiled-coil-helix domain-containing protein 3, mitochondrial, partial [Stegodyphus mimosarum]